MLSDCQNLNRLSWSPRKIMVKDLRQRSGMAWCCACAESCVVFNTGPYTVLPDNSILIAANMQSETGFPSSHQLRSYVASKSRLKFGGARCPVSGCWPSCYLSGERRLLRFATHRRVKTTAYILSQYHWSHARAENNSNIVQLHFSWVRCATNGRNKHNRGIERVQACTR